MTTNDFKTAAEFHSAAYDVAPGAAPSASVGADVETSTPPGATLPAVVPREIDQVRQRASLTALHKALDLLAHDSDRLAVNEDLFALADGLEQLRAFRRAVSDLERHVEDHVAGLMPMDNVNLDDFLTLERRRGKTRKQWQSTELLRHLVGDQLVDTRTGENVYDRLVACLPLTGSLSWRAGALREHGVDPSDWCEEAPARTTVQVKAREVEE